MTARSSFWTLNVFNGWITPTYFEMLKKVLLTAKQGDPESVIKTIDKFCWDGGFLMNIGDVKGKILDQVIKDHKPKIAVELGSHIGYSTLRIASLLSDDAVLYSVDPDPAGHAVLM